MKRLSNEALAQLENLSIGVGANEKQFAARIVEQLDRNLYLEVNAALEELGGKWTRSAKAHLFQEDPKDRIHEMILTGGYTDAKKDFGFFETPAELAAELVSAARIEPGTRVLEPSAGTGNLVDAICVAQPTATVIAVEVLPANLSKLIARFKGNTRVFPMDADFLTWQSKFLFDRVVMNPPFSGLKDIDHFTRAFDLLRPGGVLAAIMSAGVKFRTTRKAQVFRDLLEQHGGEIIDNEEGAFTSSGTNVRTVMVKVTKQE